MVAHDGQTPAYTEPIEVSERNLAVAGRLAGAAAAFFFVAFLFAFFYLRALNSDGNWNQHHLQPPWGWGVAVLVGAWRGRTVEEYTVASARALTIFWLVLGLVQVAAFLLLYVVK